MFLFFFFFFQTTVVCAQVFCQGCLQNPGSLLCLHFPFYVMNCLLMYSSCSNLPLVCSKFLQNFFGTLLYMTFNSPRTVSLSELLRQQKSMETPDDFPGRGVADSVQTSLVFCGNVCWVMNYKYCNFCSYYYSFPWARLMTFALFSGLYNYLFSVREAVSLGPLGRNIALGNWPFVIEISFSKVVTVSYRLCTWL